MKVLKSDREANLSPIIGLLCSSNHLIVQRHRCARSSPVFHNLLCFLEQSQNCHNYDYYLTHAIRSPMSSTSLIDNSKHVFHILCS